MRKLALVAPIGSGSTLVLKVPWFKCGFFKTTAATY